MTATIGEKSKPPTGGIILLKIFKYKSVTSRSASNGCLYQSILGTKLKRHLKSINQKYIWKKLFTTNIKLFTIIHLIIESFF